MGGKPSREEPGRSYSWSAPSAAHNVGGYPYPYPAYGQEQAPADPHPPPPSYGAPHHSYPPASHSYQPQSPTYAAPPATTYPSDDRRSRFQRAYSRIADNYNSLEQVTEALAKAGLESSNLIVGIDFTKSNEWTGKISFQRRSLHHIGDVLNPYEQAISIVGKTLSTFDEDNLIPCFGFGDASTHDQDVFSFYPDERPCNGFEDALSRYRELVPHVRLAGPTSFAPIIEMAMTIVERSGGQYHVLVIIADGQVTRSVDTTLGQFSSQEQKTYDAIVRASHYPLSIVLVGVGDGPWDMMKEFDDNIPSRVFDNFQFVNFTEIMLKNTSPSRKEAEFALAALMEIPTQYKATLELGLLGHSTGKSPERIALPPPAGSYGIPASFSKKISSYPSPAYDSQIPSYPAPARDSQASSTPPAAWDSQVCPICLSNAKDMAFGCGHQTCCECAEALTACPICRSPIATKIKLYS